MVSILLVSTCGHSQPAVSGYAPNTPSVYQPKPAHRWVQGVFTGSTTVKFGPRKC